MTLAAALELLCAVHMRDIEAELPTVVMGAEPDAAVADPKDYLHAWLAVRKHVLAERSAKASAAETANGKIAITPEMVEAGANALRMSGYDNQFLQVSASVAAWEILEAAVGAAKGSAL